MHVEGGALPIFSNPLRSGGERKLASITRNLLNVQTSALDLTAAASLLHLLCYGYRLHIQPRCLGRTCSTGKAFRRTLSPSYRLGSTDMYIDWNFFLDRQALGKKDETGRIRIRLRSTVKCVHTTYRRLLSGLVQYHCYIFARETSIACNVLDDDGLSSYPIM